ncbi:transmembrane protease serine 9 [Drosophila guanche]|uniref:Blast:Acrosin n=1 Tax=Drosophila guanche TaxID=7266 RepID=A0A3B0JP11_DROGU|nr:transmembrane protease serine 9 [Drosophila guanche]SPP83865.1 blast:Acrosin [Drosophila guanche]
MLLSYRCIYSMLLTTIASIMVVLSSSASPSSLLPTVRKCGGANSAMGTSAHTMAMNLAAYGLLENRISTLEAPRQTHWSKKFLAKREATPHTAPYVVSIQMMTPDQGLVHYCAGTVINEHWILTAAHCLNSPQTVENSVIVAGSHDIHDHRGEAANIQMRHIDYYIRHELYLGGVNPYDIALIYIKRPLVFDEYVQPAVLPEQDAQPEGYGTLYGWGNVSMTAVPNYPHKLQEANMPILDMELCEQILAHSGLQLHETNLCTGPLTGGVSICTADSGGPLIQQCCEDAFEQGNIVIGIVSWGKMPCGQKNAPSVFVRVSAFTDWIHQVISSATHIM